MLDVYFYFIFTIIFHNVLFHVMFLDLKFAWIACRVTFYWFWFPITRKS